MPVRERSKTVKIMRPLSIRDFSLLWTGMAVSLVGDGISLLALAWQVYELSNVPPQCRWWEWPGASPWSSSCSWEV
jgi:hypothetical protein